jgi:SOS-response transcriptional repressor LexA
MENVWIGERLKALGKRKSALATVLGIDPARVSELLAGRRNLQVSELRPLADFLEMPTERVLALLAKTEKTESSAGRAIGIVGPASSDGGFVAKAVDIAGRGRVARDLPIYGSAMGGADGSFAMNGEVMDYAERPPALAGSQSAYGIYVQGDSMSPRFEAGWLLHVNPTRPVRRGDNVVVQLQADDPDDAPLAYVKMFEARTPSLLIVVQFNPRMELSWPIDRVVSVHRIVGIGEM